MSFEIISEAVSSRTGLKVADLVSKRPRTLRELAGLTGVSVQAVLKHLKKLERLGLVTGMKLKSKGLSVKKVYYPGEVRLGDFSMRDLAVVKVSRPSRARQPNALPLDELEALAEDALVQRVRIGEQVRRLGRMIDELLEEEGKMTALLEAIDVDDGERLVLHAIFTEDTLDEGGRVISRYYGIHDPRRSIEKILTKARSLAKK